MKVNELLELFDSKDVKRTKKIKFTGVEGFDVYNITAPFEDEGKIIIAGRVERRDTEFSEIKFFEMIQEDEYQLVNDLPTFKLQDPFFTKMDGELILGGVEVREREDGSLEWKTAFLRGNNIKNLEEFFVGPVGMKDIRLFKHNDEILVFTRPQGDKGGLGKIGFTKIKNLYELTVSVIDNAKLLTNNFIDEEWGGINEVSKVGDKVIVLGHISCRDEKGLNYYPFIGEFDLTTCEIKNERIIAKREVLNGDDTKRPELFNVLFSGGLIINQDTYQLYCGVSDCEAHFIEVDRKE